MCTVRSRPCLGCVPSMCFLSLLRMFSGLVGCVCAGDWCVSFAELKLLLFFHTAFRRGAMGVWRSVVKYRVPV